MDLTYFRQFPFYYAVQRFFDDLNIPINYLTETPATPQEILTSTYNPNNPAHHLMRDVYLLGGVDDAIFKQQTSILNPQQIKTQGYEGLLIFGVILERSEHLPTRTQMAEMTRAFNREFHYTPVMVVFSYDGYLSFASCERLPYTQTWREGEKAGKVSILKDVDPTRPHTGHLKILDSLRIERAGAQAITSFAALYAYWQEVFSVSLLNKRFYRELSNWYFWALQQVEFPDDAEPDREIRNATSVIRLITRLIFVWFLKEKRLIPDALFDKPLLDGYLKYDDSTGSTYYKAILQNLFFATLNTEMQKDNPKSRKFVHRQYGVQGFYRYKRFFHDPEQALDLFKDIPFLNGGLFENLDKEVGTPDEIRIDCFSDRPAHESRLQVPDVLFFGDEDEVDLSAVYGDTKRSHEAVRGLINILNSYKFTIAENTPIEEEIALDPELLGRVFENLLASYNPETQTTARKQTGSFYTPREIVNYMVDESLLAYLSNALQASGNAGQEPLESRLRQLIAEDDVPHQFSPDEVHVLIQALDHAKILDPACGSGAFPMGILHKMVRLLGKLDPQNAEWKERQIAKVRQMITDAERIDDTRIREQILGDLEKNVESIEDAFQNNELDYGRKLYLIENCIYGVDIQPIAVQIAKLRFFISLIVEQKVNTNRPNLGIRPLPNLETKFVAANTLIGIDKPQQMVLRNPEIDKKEHELKQVRQRHFEARTPKTKEKYRKEDERLRNELAELLKNDGFPSETTEQLAQWNPYDQNASAGFFDPEWMFGMQDGFDIVLGNPPYVRHENLKKDKKYFQSRYLTYQGTADLYVYFYENGLQLLRNGGILTYITSNKFMRTNYGTALRQLLGQEITLKTIIDFGDLPVFEATAYPAVLLIEKQKPNVTHSIKALVADSIEVVKHLPERMQQAAWPQLQSSLQLERWNLVKPEIMNLLQKLQKSGITVEDYTDGHIYRGLVTGLNAAFIIDEETRNRLIAEDSKSEEIIKPWILGRDVKKWNVDWQKTYLLYIPWDFAINDYPAVLKHLKQYEEKLKNRPEVKNGRFPWFALSRYGSEFVEEFEKPKIIYPNICKQPEFAFDTTNSYANQKCFIISISDKYLLGILNSSVTFFLFRQILPKLRGDFFEPSRVFFKDFPIIEASAEQRVRIASLVEQILGIKRENSKADTTNLERQINLIVYKLYDLTYEEIKIVEPDLAISETEYNNFTLDSA